jgi:hypothetical protein
MSEQVLSQGAFIASGVGLRARQRRRLAWSVSTGA